jgi:hypothetical protein
MTRNNPRPGSREWHADFERRQRRFDRMWPWMMALSAVAAVALIAAVALGYLPLWVLFV